MNDRFREYVLHNLISYEPSRYKAYVIEMIDISQDFASIKNGSSILFIISELKANIGNN